LIQTPQISLFWQQFVRKRVIFVFQTKRKNPVYGMAALMKQNYFGMYILAIPRNSQHPSFFFTIHLSITGHSQEAFCTFRSFEKRYARNKKPCFFGFAINIAKNLCDPN